MDIFWTIGPWILYFACIFLFFWSFLLLYLATVVEKRNFFPFSLIFLVTMSLAVAIFALLRFYLPLPRLLSMITFNSSLVVILFLWLLFFFIGGVKTAFYPTKNRRTNGRRKGI